MARNKGTFNFAANFEVLAKAPLDARMQVGAYSDLVLPATWEDDDNNVWLFDGAIVVVANDPSSGIYWLKDSANYIDYASWERAGSGTGDASIGVINIGDGSAGVFAGFDSSGNITLRTFSGSGGATVEVVGDQIIIGIDASYSGESNYGVNVGVGDASIYVQKVGDALQFREIKSDSSALIIDVSGNLIVIDTSISSGVINYGENVGIGDASIYVQNVSDNLQFRELKSTTSDLIISVSDNLILFDTSISVPAGSAIDGGVWITDITPTSGGNVGDKITSSDGNVLDSCLTDVSALTVHVLALPGHTNYKPVVTINDVSVSLSEGVNQPLWDGTYNIQYDFLDASITVVHEDGARWSAIVDADTPAVVLSAEFTGGYPGSQTELKLNDTFDVSIVTDVPIEYVQVDSFGALQSGVYGPFSGTNVGFTATIANQGTATQALGMRIRVVKATGSTSANYLSSSQGSVDGKDLVNLNNTYPGVSFGAITYPGGQSAIKSPETASVLNTVTSYDTVTYSSPNGELTVTSPTLYQTPKTVAYLAGGYNISSNNLRIVANRAANDATTTQNTVVWIANTPTTLNVGATSRLRSGGNDGTSAQNHTITINASQRLLAAPTLAKDTGGTWLGTAFTWSAGATSFTRSLQVHDDDAKATYNWGAILGTNLANIPTTANIGATQYILGGFVVRTLPIVAFGWQSTLNVEISDYSKLSSTGSGQNLAWFIKALPTRSTIGDVTQFQADKWSATATFTNPTTINLLDTAATGSSGSATTFTIQEGI